MAGKRTPDFRARGSVLPGMTATTHAAPSPNPESPTLTTRAPYHTEVLERAMRELAEKCLLVDVRTPMEFREAHIKDSVNFPLGDIQENVERIKELAQGRDVGLICRTGQRAGRALEVLSTCCPLELHVMDGGVVEWESSGLPLVRGKKAVSLERQVRIAAGALVVTGVGLGLWVNPGFFGLAGFVGAGLVFAGVTDTCAMGMVLARMPWNQGPPSELPTAHGGR